MCVQKNLHSLELDKVPKTFTYLLNRQGAPKHLHSRELDKVSENIFIAANKTSTLSTRKVCTTSESCTNQTARNDYDVAKKKATFMCSTNGRSFLRRIYDEASSCVGISTKLPPTHTNRQTCKTNYENQITNSMTTAQKCTSNSRPTNKTKIEKTLRTAGMNRDRTCNSMRHPSPCRDKTRH
ncbi:hypothetical protein RRG08_021980 [Elysia crispata]|uniref:Uncharacterized protein n=1 Tax=Elysia crispata TaxID=231223 RepID=A0AAE0YI48_9GAST|nr:hypothetical protein RRG08_021980 [Elysia crispata]